MKPKKEKPEIRTMEDVHTKLPPEEQKKWEIAEELGLFDKVIDGGWKSLTSRESGRVGGILSAWLKASSEADEAKMPKINP